ncbi:hypothetical protein BU26DRAFT_434229 [Trematosphaeria pertusa]|uniref:Conidiation protein 6 n=1 Tax=Trematosphaeria pertusa TaxID=390896 RepID=A0A6A6I3B0_9PLEO|nr:uncharacterized protein BU26DRAFT_434229 [Trematosphaeria pertusa]KAF2244649.1 hypothetical protein BU26DRAFT_434229 [Trematosphaeria pertusa]
MDPQQGGGHQDKMAGLTEADQNINNTTEDVSNQAQGHKANLSNPNTSDASKEHSKQVLKDLGGEKAFYGKQGKGE